MSSIVTVLGTRPQLIKASMVSRALQQAGIEEILVETGQHYDDAMSSVFFRELGLPAPAHALKIGSGTHGDQTGRMLSEIEQVLLQRRPDVVLVYGDTNSTLAGALAASKLHIRVAHIEAGLRSFNRRMPEEINRVLTDHLSSQLFAPTEQARANLQAEGITQGVAVVGDVMQDVANFFGQHPTAVLSQQGLKASGYVLATIHRAENTDDPRRLQVIVEALRALAREEPVVFPVHPRTRAALERLQWHAALENILLLPPQGYLDMVTLEQGARVIVTDSGGVQKEAYFHRVPCITLRDETEWTETVATGWNTLLPPQDASAIVAAVRQAQAGQHSEGIYGDGHAAETIARALAAQLG
ncbi:non-hydrolyzing UDP-N-acetylglucosamine 2-epimerase [Deinococcus multiflagellatus]|uniref:Non-hydrolyzing UDP-N-acetylglucosamine 2-epimerase n=1 Tax=Deinococcus multiflagellatus TaxID=1656887 RepID=A0ABW1ZLA6_9DEIO|nr:UDP-N-acetylglucosamine 2-epimerase (non-hydrolyzing) [Deinococcus multiflagellatus]MBZ9714129.1 UDP-N-acetylglucosamine 2-epimerase (non-hydrolyzing) [Deinococcus multiflagellatus]